MKNIKVIIMDSRKGLSLPSYQTKGSVGMDLSASIFTDVIIHPQHTYMIPTGLKFILPPDMEIQIRPRSGLASKHCVTVLNSTGTVDSDYTGELFICLINHGAKPYIVTRDARIAQAIFAKVTRVELEEIDPESAENTARGDGGFGSTGGF